MTARNLIARVPRAKSLARFLAPLRGLLRSRGLVPFDWGFTPNPWPTTRAAHGAPNDWWGLLRGAVVASLCSACATTGSGWMAQPWDPSHPSDDDDSTISGGARRPKPAQRQSLASRTIGIDDPANMDTVGDTGGGFQSEPSPLRPRVAAKGTPIEGKVIGTFKNTYYDFPIEGDYSGENVPLYDGQCRARASVPRGFFETLCVQGSGLLASGNPVSFSRRDCECAPVCPRTGQKICFDVLDMAKFPWGRGATGQPITPLLTVAVDSKVLPLGTSIYIPEYEGLPRELERRTKHDGCFVAQDRGLRVQGQHVDIFTGQSAMTRLWNSLVASNVGVTVVVDSPHCTRAQ